MKNVDPWKNRPRATEEEIAELVEEISPVMNSVHKYKFSRRFWRIAIGDHVKSCLNRRQNLLSNRKTPYITFRPIDAPVVPSRKDGFVSDVLEIAKTNLRSSWHDEAAYKVPEKTKHILVGDFDPPNKAKDESIRLTTDYFISGRGDRLKRKKLILESERNGSDLGRAVLITMPRAFVEHLDGILYRMRELSNAGGLSIHVEHYDSVITKIYAALLVERGARLIQYQPGGDFGEIKSLVEATRYNDIDEFRTYGWKIHEKDVPHCAIRLAKFKARYDQADAKHKYDCLVVLNLARDESVQSRYRGILDTFADQLSTKFRICVRARAKSRRIRLPVLAGWPRFQRGAVIDPGFGDMARRVKQSMVVVHLDHPSTNFLECLYVDHPVVALQTNSDPTGIVQPYYVELERLGVFHQTTESLVKHLAQSDIPGWWRKVTEASVYREFKDTFARSCRLEKVS